MKPAELEESMQHFGNYISIIMNDTANSAQDQEANGKVLRLFGNSHPFGALLPFVPCSPSTPRNTTPQHARGSTSCRVLSRAATDTTRAGGMQGGVEEVDMLAQGIAMNAVILKVSAFRLRAATTSCSHPPLCPLPPACSPLLLFAVVCVALGFPPTFFFSCAICSGLGAN